MRCGRLAVGTVALGLLAGCAASVEVRSGTAQTVDASATTAPGSTSPGNTTAASTTPGSTAPGSTAPGSTAPGSTTPDLPIPAIDWTGCGRGQDCGKMDVPLDYADPAAGTITLNLVRANATSRSDRIGTLLVNPGGPGFGGTYLALNADAIYTSDLRKHFDIVAWDPRGTDTSTPAVDCVDDYDPYFALDPTPDDAAEEQALVDSAAQFAAACAQRNGALLDHISTVETARDMDLIRQALGEDKISYFGFSYGSELGATWLSMFPDTVRAAVLDGASDPAASGIQGAIDQAKGFEIALNAFLDDCAGKCAFAQGGDPGAAFDQVLADIDTHQYPTDNGRPALNQGIAYIGVVEALYSEFTWPDLDDALDKARQGDGSGLLALYDEYFQRKPDGTYGNELEAFIAITCLDDPGPQTVAGVDEYNDDFIAAAPRIGPSFTHAYSCVNWPAPAAQKIDVTGAGAGPVIVIGTTNDPATPYESSLAMARALEGGIFVTVHGNGHLGYPQSSCAQDLVTRYLVDLDVPDGDVDCG